jgi:hypothetical protein
MLVSYGVSMAKSRQMSLPALSRRHKVKGDRLEGDGRLQTMVMTSSSCSSGSTVRQLYSLKHLKTRKVGISSTRSFCCPKSPHGPKHYY